MNEINLTNLDKTGWETHRFGQIAFNISERVEPQQTDLEFYVGQEHLDPESLHIKRWGTPADVEGTKFKMYPGDVIFGKRRAYQRKAAIAQFEGICSAHAMVLRANSAVIDPQLFPFFIHSDEFMHQRLTFRSVRSRRQSIGVRSEIKNFSSSQNHSRRGWRHCCGWGTRWGKAETNFWRRP